MGEELFGYLKVLHLAKVAMKVCSHKMIDP